MIDKGKGKLAKSGKKKKFFVQGVKNKGKKTNMRRAPTPRGWTELGKTNLPGKRGRQLGPHYFFVWIKFRKVLAFRVLYKTKET